MIQQKDVVELCHWQKNFLFSNSTNGAKASGAAYSIIESAKMNGLKPYEYIEYILKRMTENKLTVDLLEEIMPWSEELQKINTKTKGIEICSFVQQ
ncbi:MAG: transposase domain-containing protein [Faecalibacillus faecis]